MLRTPSRPPRRRRGLAAVLRDTRGLSTVEYVILLAVIVVGAVTLWNEIGTEVKTKLEAAKNDIGSIGE